MSIFLAVDLDEPTRTTVSALISELSARHVAKWLRPDKLHVTLVFLGNATPAHVEAFVPRIDALAKRHSPFELELTGVGTFGTRRAPSVLWLGLGGALKSLEVLQRDAADALLTEPLPGVTEVERERTFSPHLTLARSKQGGAFDEVTTALEAFRSAPFRVGHLTLYESRHDEYRALHRATLG